jgi:hypothetical protein
VHVSYTSFITVLKDFAAERSKLTRKELTRAGGLIYVSRYPSSSARLRIDSGGWEPIADSRIL